MPPVLSKITVDEYIAVSIEVLRKPNQRKNWHYSTDSIARKWKSFFGTSPEVASEVWNRLVEHEVIPSGGKPKHLLYAYVLLKKYAGDDGCAQMVGCHPNTFRPWAWIFIELIHDLHWEVIQFDHRLIGWDKTKTNSNLVVDACTFGCHDKWPFDNQMWDPKRNKAGLKYDVAHAISNGHIVHWSGWYKGSESDIMMFRKGLQLKMDPNECVEADAGCSGEFCIKNPETAKCRKVKQQKGVVRARQECIFCKMKKFQCLKGCWIHNYDKHKLAVGAILVTLQLGFELGTVKLWEVEYEAEYF